MTPSGVAGLALGAVFTAALAVRRPRTLHPHGAVLEGTVRWRMQVPASGIGWVDEPPPGGEQAVRARMSKAAGTPWRLPDGIGLALKLATPGGPADVLLVSVAGFAPRLRSAVWPSVSPSRPLMTTVFPYRTPRGPVLVGARPRSPERLSPRPEPFAAALRDEPWVLDLLHGSISSRWHRFATLTLHPVPARLDDPHLRFHPVRHPLPGSEPYPVWARLRDASYTWPQRLAP